MRCTDTIIAAFLAHPKYCRREDFIQTEIQHILQFNSWAFAIYLPLDVAKHTLKQCLPDIIRKQLSTGLWGKKFAEKKSYDILKALKHAGMLKDLISNGILCYDPYKSFYKSKNFYGFLVRRDFIGSPLPDDAVLQRQLISQITQHQMDDGSWEGTVIATSLQIEKLLELGLNKKDSHIVKGVNWLFNQFRESVKRQRPNVSWKISVKNLFTGESCGAEFRSALKEMPEEDPKHGCFMSLPLIQTAFALRTLVHLGFGNDKRVLKGYESLLDIQLLPERQQDLDSKRPSGSWCAIGCRKMVEKRVKIEQKAKQKG
ncbi:MAG: hypothetical protein PHE49_08195 [bacterium]|nr:hypothetical protein [bacterium]